MYSSSALKGPHRHRALQKTVLMWPPYKSVVSHVFSDIVDALHFHAWHTYVRAVKGSPLGGVVYAYTTSYKLGEFIQDMYSNPLILTRYANREWVGSLGVSTFSHGVAPVLPAYL